MAGDYRLVRNEIGRFAGPRKTEHLFSGNANWQRHLAPPKKGNQSVSCPDLGLTAIARSRSLARLSQVSAIMSS